MLFYNKTILLSNLRCLNGILNNYEATLSNHTNNNFFTKIYSDKIAIKHYNYEKINSIRIWKTKSLFNYLFYKLSGGKFIGGIDYIINNDNIKIDYLFINDNEYKNICNKNIPNDILDESEAFEIKKSLINYIKFLAKKENKNKIIIDVHQNLRLYEKYYNNEGFIITNRKCLDNPYWIETEFILDPDNSKNIENKY